MRIIRTFRVSIGLLLCICLKGFVPETGYCGPTTVKKERVHAEAKLSQDGINVGAKCHLLLIVTIDKGWHINSATPNLEEYSGTFVDMEKLPGVKLVDVQYPEGVQQAFEFADVPLDVYEGSVRIPMTIEVADTTKPGKYDVGLNLHYQACSNNVCLAQTALRVSVPLRVVARGETVSPSNEILFKAIER